MAAGTHALAHTHTHAHAHAQDQHQDQHQDLLQTLTDLGLEQYLPNCLQAGFHSFQSLSAITEAELTALGVRLGHRRKLLRRIAREHQWPDDRPLPTSYSELQRHRNSVRRLARGTVDPDTLEENYYSLASPPQSPAPWSREASTSSSSSVSRQESVEGTRPLLADVLRTSSRLFPIAIHEENSHIQEREKISRALRGLDDLGLRIPTADLSLPDSIVESQSEKCTWPNPTDVIPHGLNSGLTRGNSEAGVRIATEALETFVEAFSQSFNHFLFLISESELRQRFDPRKWTSDTNLPIDVCMVLALGAKASGFQVEDVQYKWYREARLQLLSEDCQDELWTMRVLVLICIFEIDDDIEVSYRFLNAAITLGLENGLATPESDLNWMEEPSLSQCLRLWETIQFLNMWFLLQPQTMGRPLPDSSRFLNIEQPPLLSDHGSNGRLVQMSIAALSNHVQEILNDRRDSTNQTSSLLYKAHLQALDSWHAELPLYTCLQTPNLEDSRMVNPKADYRQKTAILNVQCLFLGIVCVLLQPALMNVLQDPTPLSGKELVVYARRCISSATILIRLCDEIMGSGYPLHASWISQHFLFNATLVLIADMNRSNSALEEFVSSNECLECIGIAQNLLDKVSSASPQATIVRLFCRAAGVGLVN